jgi:hypothetical protein
MKRISVVFVALGATVLTGLVFAGPRGEGGMRDGFFLERMSSQLELAPEQEQTIEEIISGAKPRFQALRDKARNTREQMMGANPDEPTYATDVAQASQASATHAAELVNLAAEVKAQVYGVLDADQKQRATELMSKMQERRAKFMESGPRRHRRGGRRPSASQDCQSGDVEAG